MADSFRLAYILGAGHCGSTLLNLLLNGHSQMLGLSEIETVGRYTGPASAAEDNPLDLPFWQEVRHCYERSSGEPFAAIDIFHPPWKTIRGWSAEDIARWGQTNQHLLSCIAQQSGARVLVDSSKFWQRLYLLRESRMFSIKVIHLVRDGRAIMNSYVRKGAQPATAIRRWAAPSLWAFYLCRKFEKSDWLQIRYEELAAQPEITLRRICAFLQVDFEPQMLAYRQHVDVGIGGNRMRARQDERIFLDERWKSELSRANRVRFALIGGLINRLYGY